MKNEAKAPSILVNVTLSYRHFAVFTGLMPNDTQKYAILRAVWRLQVKASRLKTHARTYNELVMHLMHMMLGPRTTTPPVDLESRSCQSARRLL